VGNTTPVEPDFTQYEYFRWTGTATATGGSIEVQSTPWLRRSLGFTTYGIGGVFDVGGYKTNTAATGNHIGGTFGNPTLFPWRANAIAIKVSPLGSGLSGGGWEIGDFGIYPNPRVRVGCVPFSQLPEGTVLGSLQGRFEFSTNGVNAEISWTGRDY
jgi:hypothetical protein